MLKIEILRKIFKNKKILILLSVAALMYLFSFMPTKDNEEVVINNFKAQELNESKLEKILSNIEGAGKVRVYITYKNTGKNNLASDVNDAEKTIKIIGKSGKQEVYVTSVDNPEIAGILVTATGADNDIIKTEIKKCVKAATNVAYNKIEVAKGVR